MTIKIPFRLPSLNEYIDACRNNRYGASKYKKNIENDISWCLVKMKPIEQPVTFHFTWYEQTKRRDKDNVAFAKKFILDALQKCGKLKNDNNQYVLGFTDSFVYGQGDWVEVNVDE